jgi:hypothetical protein
MDWFPTKQMNLPCMCLGFLATPTCHNRQHGIPSLWPLSNSHTPISILPGAGYTIGAWQLATGKSRAPAMTRPRQQLAAASEGPKGSLTASAGSWEHLRWDYWDPALSALLWRADEWARDLGHPSIRPSRLLEFSGGGSWRSRSKNHSQNQVAANNSSWITLQK